ncbi:MAG: class I SAM-dependent methyltransferase [Devosia sp.]
MADSTEHQIRFTDGAGYERMMGLWSRPVGEVFLDWLAPKQGLAWADIGCGNGAFTELLVDRCAPTSIAGIDPSPEQLSYARQRHTAGIAQFTQGSAMDLPIADASVDAAAMALVIFFVPEPAKGVAEMMRIVRPGGSVSAYAWDFLDGGFPWEPVHEELRALGLPPAAPPSAPIARLDNLTRLWQDSGLQQVESRIITIEREFPSFDDFWATAQLAPTMAHALKTLAPTQLDEVRERVRAKLEVRNGKIVHWGRANAAKGIVPR